MCQVSQKWPFSSWFIIMVKTGPTHSIGLVCLLSLLLSFLLCFFPWRNYLVSKEPEALWSGPREIHSLSSFSKSVQRITSSRSVYNFAQADGMGWMETVGKDPRKWVTTTFSPMNQRKNLKDKGLRKAKHCRVRPESQKKKNGSSHSSGVTQRMEWVCERS